jgi:hypothetical protein
MAKETRDDKIDALRRYEDARRQHLGAALNLSFGLAVAATGFCIKQLVDKDSRFSTPGSYYFTSAIVAFILTTGLCMLAIWTRLRDFRVTAQKLRKEVRGATDEELEELKTTARCLGKCTWCVFRIQFVTFAVGVALLATSLCILYHDRLFPK